MTLALLRVDERLIHGQVVVGWGGRLHPDRIVVVDNEIAGSPWEQELYCLGLPPDIASEFVTVSAARAQLDAWRDGEERVFVLTRNPETMLQLARGGLLSGLDVNLGGIHHASGREEVLPYLFLSPGQREVLRELGREGALVSARDLPGARQVQLTDLLPGDNST